MGTRAGVFTRVIAAAVLLCALSAAPARAGGITNSGSDLRDGWYPDQPGLSPEVVGGSTFGQLWSKPVDGQVYAQPLVHAGHVIVATERNRVVSLDGANGAVAWSVALPHPTPFDPADVECTDLEPDIGVTATPVIDPATNTIYLTHKTYVSGSSGPAAWWMDALDATTGVERAGFPVRLQGAAQNAPGQTFQPTTELQRPGLLLMDGVVYAAFGGHCDRWPYQGWVFGVSTAGQVKARWTSVTSGSGAGIWQSGSGLMSDGPGRLFVATGNGGSPAPPLAGTTPNGMFGESIVRLAVQPDGSLKAMDFFAPYDAARLDSYDADFASGGVTALRDESFGTTEHPHLAVAVGKAGYVYLLDRDDLGGIGTGENQGDRVVSRSGPRGGVWARPGVWPGDGGWVIVPTASGYDNGDQTVPAAGYLDFYRYGISGTGKPTLVHTAQSDDGFGFSTSAPIITSDGVTSGSALAWVTWAPFGYGTGAQLRAYDAVPGADGKPRLRFSMPIGRSSKFAMPGVGDGRVYVGTREGNVMAFGAPVQAAVQGSSTAFGTATVGQSVVKSVTLTTTAAVRIDAITATPSVFTADPGALGLPKTVPAGTRITVPVTFTPASPGGTAGSLSVQTDQGTFPFGLTGTGQAQSALLVATPATVSFGGTVVGSELDQTITFSNAGGQPLTVAGLDAPTAPFTLDGAPAAGQALAPGRRVDVTVRFAPAAPGTYNDEVTLRTSAGDATIGLSGTAGTGPHLTIAPARGWAFGDVPVGQTSTPQSVTLANTGDTTMTFLKSKPPGAAGPFAVLDGGLPEGTTLAPGATRTLRVTFTPQAPGPASAVWTLNGNDDTGLQELALSGRGVAPGSGGDGPPPGPGGGDPPATLAPSTDPLAPAPIGPDLSGQGTARLAPGLRLVRLRVARDRRTLTVVGLASPRATGPLSLTLAARVGATTVTLATGRRLAGGRFVVHLGVPRRARGWRSLTVSARYAGNGLVWPGAASMVLVRAR